MNNKGRAIPKTLSWALFLFVFQEVLKCQQIICEGVNHCHKVLFQYYLSPTSNLKLLESKMRARKVACCCCFFPNLVLKFQNIFKNTREKIVFTLQT